MKYRLSDSTLGIAALGMLFFLFAACAEEERSVQKQIRQADSPSQQEQLRAQQFTNALIEMQSKQAELPAAQQPEPVAQSTGANGQDGMDAMTATASVLQEQIKAKPIQRVKSVAARRSQRTMKLASDVQKVIPQLAVTRSYRPLPETERVVERRVTGKLFSVGDAQP